MKIENKVLDAIAAKLSRIRNLKRFCVDNKLGYVYINQLKNRKRDNPNLALTLNLCRLLGIDPSTGEILQNTPRVIIGKVVRSSMSQQNFTDESTETETAIYTVVPDTIEMSEMEARMLLARRSSDPYSVFEVLAEESDLGATMLPVDEAMGRLVLEQIKMMATTALEKIHARRPTDE